jgi:PleD family two-component response regulator
MKRTVVVLADDLFWRTKIDHAARSAQAPAVFLSDPAQLTKTVDPLKTALVLVDLTIRQDPFAAIAALKKGTKTKGIPVVGWYEHTRKDLEKKGTEAGCNEVMSRSSFSQKLADLIMTYALPGATRTEEEEKELPEE